MRYCIVLAALHAAVTTGQIELIHELKPDVKWESKRAFCRMKHDPTNPGTLPYGYFKLYQASPTSDVLISGNMYQMPPSSLAYPTRHGFHINYKTYYGDDCHWSTVPRWDEQVGPVHTGPAGVMNMIPSQVGNLDEIIPDSSGFATYSVSAIRPSMYGSPDMSILGRAMVIYSDCNGAVNVPVNSENPYSYFYANNIEAIACCNITPFKVIKDVPISPDRNGRLLDDIEEGTEILTPETYKEIFGVDYDPADWELEAFIQ